MLKLTNKQTCLVVVIVLIFALMVIHPLYNLKKKQTSQPTENFDSTVDKIIPTIKSPEDGPNWNPSRKGANINPFTTKCSKQCCVAGTWPTPHSIISPDEKVLPPGSFLPSNDSCTGYNSSGCLCLDPKIYEKEDDTTFGKMMTADVNESNFKRIMATANRNTLYGNNPDIVPISSRDGNGSMRDSNNATLTPSVENTFDVVADNFYADEYLPVNSNFNLNGEPISNTSFGSSERCDIKNNYKSNIDNVNPFSGESSINYPVTSTTYGDLLR